MPNYTKVWNKAIPLGSEAASQGASRLRDLKYALEERLATEHSDVSGSSGDAFLRHNAGRCAVCFYGTTAEIGALTSPPKYSIAYDTDLNIFKYYSGSAWVATTVIDADLLPWYININVYMPPKAHTNWNTINLIACTNGAVLESAGNQNDEITWDVILSAGTWSVSVMYRKDADNGIISVQFDTVEKGTIDTYIAVATLDNISTISNIAVAATAKVELKLKMATKNAASSDYMGQINGLTLRRTA